ncbi:MAG: redoxin domain-containing protein, partial [Deltaproteobacteria bacterium]|nr:redoxin domain-containing protein [Deltaproteobacteria bacterium]
MPEVGDKAPDFNMLDQNQERVELKKILAKGKVLLVFYPGNDTPVCTAQLCDYRDHYGAFQQLGVQIYGISIAHPEDFANKKFADKYQFPFPLLNDYDSRVTKAYKVISITGMPKRALFLLAEDGTILYKHVTL